MAFKPEEIQRLQTLADEMANLIEDEQNTSNEAVVAYGKIGKICTRAIALDAATAAKLAKRTEGTQKFQTARQTRLQKKKGGTASSTPQPTQAQRSA